MNEKKINEAFSIISIRLQDDFADAQIFNLEKLKAWLNDQIDNIELLKNRINDDEKKELLNKIRSKYYVDEQTKEELYGNIFHIEEQKNFIPWFEEFKQGSEMYYFNRFRDLILSSKRIDYLAFNQIDQHTNRIMDRCGNPNQDEFSKKGLVIGQVQSGKTLNYSMLVNKAADVGYKLIIVITNNIDALRKQTQERLENDFVGFRKDDNFNKIFLPLAKFDKNRREPDLITTLTHDFKVAAARHSNLTSPRREPIVIISKKDPHILRSIFSAFYGENYETAYTEKLKKYENTKVTEITKQIIKQKIINMPLLFIDDEADIASLNTKKEEELPSRINEIIRCILAIFKQKSYVAYTATPYANCFVDPYDKEDKQLLNDDLYPSSFIHYIEPPKKTYMGYSRFFYDQDKDFNINKIIENEFFINKFYNHQYISIVKEEDFKPILPLDHKNYHPVLELPKSLEHAIRIFLISRAIQIKENFKIKDENIAGSVNQSMIINVSRYKSVHREVLTKVSEYLIDIQKAFRLGNARDNIIKLFNDSFSLEFKNTDEIDYTFNEISEHVYTGLKSIVVKVINNSSEDKLDYDDESFKKTGRHIIAIGGNSLSRGITLEGLTTTYILRDTPQDDTLLQLARWFGYRQFPKNYEYLCRVFMPKQTFDNFREASERIDDFAENQIKAMISMNYSPLNFGLMVRQSETGRKLTAAAKIRNAEKNFLFRQNYSQKQFYFHSYQNDEGINKANIEATESFILENHNDNLEKNYKGRYHYYKDIDGRKVYDLLENKLKFHQDQVDLNKQGIDKNKISLLGKYLEDRINVSQELDRWDIVIPYKKNPLKNEEEIKFANFNFIPRARDSGISFVNSSPKLLKFIRYQFTDPEDITVGFNNLSIQKKYEQETSTKKHRAYFFRERQKPLLIISLLNIKDKQYKFKEPLITYSICFNKTKINKDARILFTVNSVAQRLFSDSQQTNIFESDE